MGRYSNIAESRPRDYWPTVDPAAISTNFLSWLRDNKYTEFVEPCAGNGALVKLLEDRGLSCVGAYDIEPQAAWITKQSVEEMDSTDVPPNTVIITNPPFSWNMMNPMLFKLMSFNRPVCFLLPASFMQNVRSASYMNQCSHVFSVGRLFWILEEGGNP